MVRLISVVYQRKYTYFINNNNTFPMSVRVLVFALVTLLSAATLGDISSTGMLSAQKQTVNWNSIIDIITSMAKKDTILEGTDTIALPDVEKEFSQNVFGNEIYGELFLSNGMLKNITTIRRIKDVSILEQDNRKVKIWSLFTLDDLRVIFDFKVKFLGQHISGNFEGTADSNTFGLTIVGRDSSEGCTVSLDEVKLVNIGKFSVMVSGLKFLNIIASSVFTSFLEEERHVIVPLLEKNLFTKITNALAVYDCSEMTALLSLWAR